MMLDTSQNHPTVTLPNDFFTEAFAPPVRENNGLEAETGAGEIAAYAGAMPSEEDPMVGGKHQKLYEVQHWRQATGRYLDGTEYGYDPQVPPLTQSEFRALPSAMYHAVVGAMANGLAGERIALECSAALCSYAPDDNARMFLATQVIDEARHVEVFTKRLKSLGRHDIDDTLARYVNPRMFRFHTQMRERVCDSRDFAGGIIGQNLALEGLALGFFEFNAALLQNIDPGSSHILETVLLDERRHVGFGLVRLRELCEEDEDKGDYVRDTFVELSREMLAIMEENADHMTHLGIDPAQPMGKVRRYHEMHLRKLGIDASAL